MPGTLIRKPTAENYDTQIAQINARLGSVEVSINAIDRPDITIVIEPVGQDYDFTIVDNKTGQPVNNWAEYLQTVKEVTPATRKEASYYIEYRNAGSVYLKSGQANLFIKEVNNVTSFVFSLPSYTSNGIEIDQYILEGDFTITPSQYTQSYNHITLT